MKTVLKSRSICAFAVAAMLLAIANEANAFAPHIIVTFKGRSLKFGRGVQPYRSQGTVMVPVRETGLLVGAKVELNPDGKHLVITFARDSLTYQPGHHGYRLNGLHQNMSSASESRNSHLFVPIRLFNDVTTGLVHAEIR